MGEHRAPMTGSSIEDDPKRSLDAIEVVRFIEPLIRLSDGAVEGDGERERRAPQWSRR